MPEIRRSKVALDYLASHPAMNTFRKYSALEEFRRRLDRPVDLAIVSWSNPPPAFPLALDPAHPDGMMPAGYVDTRRALSVEWIPAIVLPFFGLAFWFAGMNIVLGNLVPIGRVVVGSLPLLALPWWGQELPKALGHLNVDVGAAVEQMLGDIDIEARLTASEPGEALLRNGERISFAMDRGLYADTIGRFRFVLSDPMAKRSADEALAMLAANIAAVVGKLDRAERIELFENLRRDKQNRLADAGLAFLPAAKEALVDPKSTAELQLAARRFLSVWLETPLPEPRRGEPAFEARLKLFRGLVDIPVTVIAYPASIIVERAEQTPAPAKKSRY